MASDTTIYLRELKKAGYTVTGGGGRHYKIYWKNRLVTVASSSPRGGRRSFQNLKAQVQRFSRDQVIPG